MSRLEASRRQSDDRTTVILDRSVSQRDVGSEERRPIDQNLTICDKVKNGFTIIISYLLLYITVLFLDWGNGFQMAGLVKDMFDPRESLPRMINLHGNSNDSAMFQWQKTANKDWGILAILTTFIPGVIYALGNIFSYILGTNSIFKKSEDEDPQMYIIGLKATGLVFFYPFYVCLQIFRTIVDQKENNFRRLMSVISMAAFLQSAPQLLLQFHTICNGQRPTCIQIVCICCSFYFLIKTAIEHHIGPIMFFEMAFTEKLIKTLKLFPLYITCLFFRIGTLVIISTHLNWWCIVPFLIIIVIISTIAKKNGHNEMDALLAGPINLFVMASGNQQNSEISLKDKKKFYKISSIAVFIIYCILLVGFLVVWILVYKETVDTHNFNIIHWEKKIFYKDDIRSYGMYIVFSAILFSGILNLTFLLIDTGHELEVATSKSDAGVNRSQTGGRIEMNERNNQEALQPNHYAYDDDANSFADSRDGLEDYDTVERGYNRKDSFADSREGLDEDNYDSIVRKDQIYQN